MTTTSFNVGLSDNARLSSRVLRPPGGGHTDIFGGEPEPVRTGRRLVPQGSAQADNAAAPQPAPTTEENAPTDASAPPQEQAPTGNDVPKQESDKPEPPKTQAQPAAEPPRRVRVPPGGFSSGLW